MPRITIAQLTEQLAALHTLHDGACARIAALEAQLEGAQAAAAHLTAENNALTLDLDRAHKALRTQRTTASPVNDCGEAGHAEGRCGNASCFTLRYTDRAGRVWEKRRDGNRTYSHLVR